MAISKELRVHQDWLGMAQPSVGLVVSGAALGAAQAFPNANVFATQQALGEVAGGSLPVRAPFWDVATRVLGWEARDVMGAPEGPPLPDELSTYLREYGETLRPTYALADGEDPAQALALVWELPAGTDFDAAPIDEGRAWKASPQARFERLLRDTGVGLGLLANQDAVRIVTAPRGESSGYLQFRLADMLEVGGRPLLAAFHMLLEAPRIWHLPAAMRLPTIVRESRRYQNHVSTQLAEQVLQALFELLRGLAAADAESRGELLAAYREAAPQEVYAGLLTTLLRMVFLLYAEDQGLMPASPLYADGYSLTGLYERLRTDAGRYPDTMDQRYGAWSRLLALFRLVHDGSRHPLLAVPPRAGQLFDPDTHPFLEGRTRGEVRRPGARITPPRVSDGVIYRVLENLLMLDGERLSYRALDVEQIGSVYEAMMGFSLEIATGPSVAVGKAHVVVDLAALLAAKPAERIKALADRAGVKVDGKAADAVKKATSPEELAAALGKRISKLTPQVLEAGSLVLQPTAERRRSGSHYTPRSLTRPIVETTLRPVLAALGESPTPKQILELKVCDPAMGSGAFLVETCRYLGDELLKAWAAHFALPNLPPGEDPVLHARRLVAQRCLYGVDKNPFAVDLARLSLWLVTFAKNHPFTFLDHALRCGDSLVGLDREQILALGVERGSVQLTTAAPHIDAAIAKATGMRHAIHAMGDSDEFATKAQLLGMAEEATEAIRALGDAAVAVAFSGGSAKARKERRGELGAWAGDFLAGRGPARPPGHEPPPVVPFHWPIEFPEVFARGGFDAFVGNPPFAGKNTIAESSPEGYIEWLKALHVESHGNADLVAHFFRRAFGLLCSGGAFGLIATNTIAQGDTRSTGLRWLCVNGCTLFNVNRRYKWPGLAAVIVSVIHGFKGKYVGTRLLDGKACGRISAYLFHTGGDSDPVKLHSNSGKSFQGSILLGMGFTFDDSNPSATPITQMNRLISDNPKNAERIFPYIGGEDVNSVPGHKVRRYTIDFGNFSEAEVRRNWPDLMSIVEDKVKPERDVQNRKALVERWWQYAEKRPGMLNAISPLSRVLVTLFTSQHVGFVFLPAGFVYANTLNVFAFDEVSVLAVLQSRFHEIWARFFGSSLEDRLRYTPSDCFETFPFPPAWTTNHALVEAGSVYDAHRAALMECNEKCLTEIYNCFHDPEETDAGILRLRDLHTGLDAAMAAAYGWTDLDLSCDFRLDHEDPEDDEDGTPRRRKKPWRYRWSDATRDEVLARLLALNAERATEELEAVRTEAAAAPKARKRAGRQAATGVQATLPVP